jgi:hypothetical protein
MKIFTVSECVGPDKKVKFVQYFDDNLYYVCENGFEFPVPISDTGTARFLSEDKSMFFMRWIRKHLELIKDAFENKD